MVNVLKLENSALYWGNCVVHREKIKPLITMGEMIYRATLEPVQ